MKLPDSYKSKMMNLLGSEYEAYEASLSEPLNHCLRVNTLKISVDDFLKISPFKLTPVPWCSNAFYYDIDVDSPSKHPFYYAGLYYLQEASATLPAATIPIEEGDFVLDICAAPGGKSTELAARLKNTGILVTNDISASRLKALQKNLEAFGVENAVITCETPDKLSESFEGYFDKILIDAPCSGEGMFRKSTSMISAWELNGNEKFAEIQRSILKEAVKMLKPGGMILYSTCTFDPREDEEQVRYLLALDESLEVKPIKMYEGFEKGHSDWLDMFNGAADDISDSQDSLNLSYTAHLFPHRVKGEGHFVSLIGSISESDAADSNKKIKGRGTSFDLKKAPICLQEFLNKLSWDEDKLNRLWLSKDKLFLNPAIIPDTKGLRTMRTGVYLGELKKNRFEPSQSFAMILKDSEFDNTINLSAKSQAVYRYLRGETLDIDEMTADDIIGSSDIKNGWTLVEVEGYPLGFAKNVNGTLKNKYLPGWRMQ